MRMVTSPSSFVISGVIQVCIEPSLAVSTNTSGICCPEANRLEIHKTLSSLVSFKKVY